MATPTSTLGGELSRDASHTPMSEPNVRRLSECTIPLVKLMQSDYESLLESIGDAKVVMIGESTHGTEEYYRIRAEITKLLIERKGFDFVAVEGDFPDIYRAHRFVTHGQRVSADKTAEEALSDLKRRFPEWMWRNHAVKDFLEWLRFYNQQRIKSDPAAVQVGFLGLDLYSLFQSAERVIEYLERIDPNAADWVRDQYGTLFLFKDSIEEYGMSVTLGLIKSQEENVRAILMHLIKNAVEYIKKGVGFSDEFEEYLVGKENARVVKDAENYYRQSWAGGTVTWNIRDTHMVDTLQSLLEFYTERHEQAIKKVNPDFHGKREAKAVVWAHNSHLWDAAATAWTRVREVNVGNLCRKRFGLGNTFNIGFSTHTGYVRAAERWGGRNCGMKVLDSLPESYEGAFHRVREMLVHQHEKEGIGEMQYAKPGDFALLLRSNSNKYKPEQKAVEILDATPRIQRAIGVQYVKRTERESHYIKGTLPRQFDFLVFIDQTNALKPLDE